VNNDGWHGMQDAVGSALLTAGGHTITIPFNEGGGGCGLEVSWRPSGGEWQQLQANVLSPVLPGLFFQAYNSGGDNPTLGTTLETVNDPVWNGWTPDVEHAALNQNVWYSNDAAFVNEIPDFNSVDNFYMRFRGQVYAPEDGEYEFKTRSDDGSFVIIDGDIVVNNDGWHGMQDATGTVTVTAGWHLITIPFNEGGGGCGLEVSIRGGPLGTEWHQLGANGELRALAHSVPPPPPPPPPSAGLYLQWYNSGGVNPTLGTILDTVEDPVWNDWEPTGEHTILHQNVWYSNDQAFVDEIPDFNLLDNFYMRFRGQISIPEDGDYDFKTRSDDGSFVLIDGAMVVNNDGWHGMQDAEGTVTLTAGWHLITIPFNEGGGGCGLEVSWRPSGGEYAPLAAESLLPVLPGLFFQAYNSGGDNPTLGTTLATVENPTWNDWTPTVSHVSLAQTIWYSNDQAFVNEIPDFNLLDNFYMRWRGQFYAAEDAEYEFKTRSDDGSFVIIDGVIVVNNDGWHGMQDATGSVTLSQGYHSITIPFNEGGGGCGLEASVRGGNFGEQWLQLGANGELNNFMGLGPPPAPPPPPTSGLFFQWYDSGGDNPTLGTIMDTAEDDVWNGWTPSGEISMLDQDIWYSNDAAFVNLIPDFNSWDNFYMRWRGMIIVDETGDYDFKTRSDDGSFIVIDGNTVVNNDGWHGMQDAEGSVTLGAGTHTITITMNEGGGGCGLEASWRPAGGEYVALGGEILLPVQSGLYFEWYNSGGDNPTLGTTLATVEDAVWNDWTPTGFHQTLSQNVWYSNDAAFVNEIPDFDSWDNFYMRFRGQVYAPEDGDYDFKTTSDDGSFVIIDGVTVVNNDGWHGMQDAEGTITLSAGWHSITIPFNEGGGGCGLEVSVRPSGGEYAQLGANNELRSIFYPPPPPPPPPAPPQGLYLEWYDSGGDNPTLGTILDTVEDPVWNNWTPSGAHESLNQDIWYSNDAAFVNEIPDFNSWNNFYMRFRGRITVAVAGVYDFKTRSDDGSFVIIDGEQIVNNDGWHGMQDAEGTVTLTAGWHLITIPFNEGGGGCGLEVSWRPSGGEYTPLSADVLMPAVPGLYLEWYDSGGDNPTLGTTLDTVLNEVWNGWTPTGAHPTLNQNVWYSNDAAFVSEIPDFNSVDNFYMRFSGQVYIDTAGSYDFKTRSDDGSFVFIDGAEIVNNDGWHGMQDAVGTVELSTGWHAITIPFNEGGGGCGLEVSWRLTGGYWDQLGNGLPLLSLLSGEANTAAAPPPPAPAFVIIGNPTNNGLAEDGNVAAACVAPDSVHEARCCSDTEIAGYSDKLAACGFPVWTESNFANTGYGCVHDATLADNVEICAADGARLCTIAEMAAGCTAGTGCGHDADLIWTDSTCDPVPENVMVIIGNPNNGNAATNPPYCADANELHEVRCCSDFAIDGYSDKLAACGFPVWTESAFGNTGYGCQSDATLAENMAVCAADGARLCSIEEMEAGCTSGTGCGHDADLIWTGTVCEPPATSGLYFQWYDSGGDNPTLGTTLETVEDDVWNDWTPSGEHTMLEQAIWYPNDQAFVDEIPDFNSYDNFYMRWRGQILIPEEGTYDFKTRSDDGSFVIIDGAVIVNNDGWHGMQDAEGSVALTAGPHTITIPFNEGGGGCGLEVSWRPSGGEYAPLSNEVLIDQVPGLFFEAYNSGGDNPTLGTIMDTAEDAIWNGWTPDVSHIALNQNVWYSNDQAFVDEIPDFNLLDNFYMRWRGQVNAPVSGVYDFKTTSDDGSFVVIDNILVVNNDGWHGMQDAEGSIELSAGWHFITITFNEGGGGCGLEASVRLSGVSEYAPLGDSGELRSVAHVAPPPPPPACALCAGLFMEWYDSGGDNPTLGTTLETVEDEVWNGWTPSGSHTQLNQDIWYSNDNAFVDEIPDFNSWDNFYMRWRGQILIPEDGDYDFKTRSDDGSFVIIDGATVVDNDGWHGMQDAEGTVTLTAGTHTITIPFNEGGGGCGLEVSWRPAGGNYAPLSANVLMPVMPGLAFEAYNSGGNNPTLGTIMDTAGDTVWNGWTPDVTHVALNQAVWYSNDQAFVDEIPDFNSVDNFYMRFRGSVYAPADGLYFFKTTSDDGSFVYIDGVQVVNNDGWHGMQDAEGSITLTEGYHQILITFNEGGGGCGLEVSVKLDGVTEYAPLGENGETVNYLGF